MARWEQQETEQIIRANQAQNDAQSRLVALFDPVSTRSARRDGEATMYVEAERRSVIALAAVLGIQQLMKGVGTLPVADAASITASAVAMVTAPMLLEDDGARSVE